MKTGIFLFGGVEMDDAGAGPPRQLIEDTVRKKYGMQLNEF